MSYPHLATVSATTGAETPDVELSYLLAVAKSDAIRE
jgi:hypothetical protein